MVTNKERNLIKKKILKCLTEDFKGNQAIFDKQKGFQVFNTTNLDMVMEAVCKGLEMAKYEINNQKLELAFCEKCWQMTNHLNRVCQKCKL